jgi:signal peptidase II
LKHIRNYVILFLLAGIVIGLDQWTKALVRANLPLGGVWLPAGWDWLAPYARIIYTYNTGAAFGSFQGDHGWIFTCLALLVTAFVIYYLPQIPPTDWWMRLALGLLVGGALGNNLFDRLLFGKVTDFISVGNFWVFNVADMSLNVSVAVLLLGALIKEFGESKKAQGEPNILEEV